VTKPLATRRGKNTAAPPARLDILRDLLALPTAPLYETAVIEWLLSFAAERGLPVRRDRYGNLLMRYRRGPAARRPLIFCAHMDHPGFAALEMSSPTTLAAVWRGGVPAQLFHNARVRFFDRRWVKGRVVSRPETIVSRRPTRVEIAVERPVAPGSVGMWDFPGPRRRGNLLYARGQDDVAGVAAIACAFDEACRSCVTADFYALFTRGEEGGFVGAIAACRDRTLPPRGIVVALETSRELPNARLGEGVIVRVGDRASIFTPWTTDAISSAAKELATADESFKYLRRLMDGGTCESTVYCAWGYDATGLCLPLRNYHNVNWETMTLAPECIDLRDFESLVKLLIYLPSRKILRPSRPRRQWDVLLTHYEVLRCEKTPWPGRRSC
jgi:endoglucanase